MRDPFPLQWPSEYPRTPHHQRERPHLHPQFAPDRDETYRRLERRGAANIVITSNLPTNRNGMPMSSARADDPGIAVWWIEKGTERVIPCDRWSTVQFNMRAICKTVEALCGIERWGTLAMVERAMSGYTALPPGSAPSAPAPPAKRSWRELLGMPTSIGHLPPADQLAIARTRYRARIKDCHPDNRDVTMPSRSSDGDLAIALNIAMEEAEAELAPRPSR